MVEALSNYKKSYFWYYGNSTCSDLTGSTGLKKIRLLYLLNLFEGRGEKGLCDLVCVCGVPMDDWTNGGYVDVLFTCGECRFSSFGSWSCSEK